MDLEFSCCLFLDRILELCVGLIFHGVISESTGRTTVRIDSWSFY